MSWVVFCEQPTGRDYLRGMTRHSISWTADPAQAEVFASASIARQVRREIYARSRRVTIQSLRDKEQRR